MHKLITNTIQTISCPSFDLSLEGEMAVSEHKSVRKYTLVKLLRHAGDQGY